MKKQNFKLVDCGLDLTNNQFYGKTCFTFRSSQPITETENLTEILITEICSQAKIDETVFGKLFTNVLISKIDLPLILENSNIKTKENWMNLNFKEKQKAIINKIPLLEKFKSLSNISQLQILKRTVRIYF